MENHLYAGVCRFFDGLDLYEDRTHGHLHKVYLQQAIAEFLTNETKRTAFAVYRAFFDIYRVHLEGSTDPFLDLLDVLKNYEENAAVLIDKQRDHYIHTVNVFVLGLCIYAQNAAYRAAFCGAVLDARRYPFAYEAAGEEFLYRWGSAALFHDVGYPIEIAGRQVNKFVDFITDADGADGHVNVQLTFGDFSELNRIASVAPRADFTAYARGRYDGADDVDLLKPNDLLALRLHDALGVGLADARESVDGFVDAMAAHGFIDHGYYSAVVVLKWYGYLMQKARYNPAYFYEPVLDSASAIFLHNCYRNMFQKPPYALGPLRAETHPVAYLLILCDELQEWNRAAYGILDKRRTPADSAEIDLDNGALRIVYVARSGALPDDFGEKKAAFLRGVLALDAVFGDISMGCRSLGQPAAAAPPQEPYARESLDVTEALARAIHARYAGEQRLRDPAADVPEFDALPDSLKYSNLRQALDIPDKLRAAGLEMRPWGADGKALDAIPAVYIEPLAEQEHRRWAQERLANGWTYAPAKDIAAKRSPYLVPYEALPDDIKALDRDAVTGIPALLRGVGCGVYEQKEEGAR
ncbi:MAG: RyR domain-containing protein [Oscillospiraceae bacterium]|nr:RyR domain-containing protein [Oscillospiraceae bacterium]